MAISNSFTIKKILTSKQMACSKSRVKKANRTSFLILTICLMFFILEVPVGIFLIVHHVRGSVDICEPCCTALLWQFLNILMYTNHIINFPCYYLSGGRFRAELFNMISKYLKLKDSSTQSKNVTYLSTADATNPDASGTRHVKIVNSIQETLTERGI
ncbi:hypothetical protein ACOME3_000638 [Neoechinorhynchus agilis]